MDLFLKKKNVIVTGASQGIGYAICERFLEEGANVFLVARRDEALRDAQRVLQEKHPESAVSYGVCDCRYEDEVIALRERIATQWPGIDVVVANVGDGRSVPDPVPDTSQWQRVWASNFDTALNTARTFLPALEQAGGSLLFIASITGLEAFGAPVDYSTAKTAVIALTKNVARKVAPEVRVNALAPGNVFFPGGSWDEKIKKDRERVEGIIQASVPMKRFGTPGEIADAAVFLCSRRALFITGAVLTVDGGQTVRVA